MADKNKLTEDLQSFEEIAIKDHELIQKLNEFIVLLDSSKIDTDNIKGIKTRINKALDQKLSNEDLIQEIKHVSLSHTDKLDQLTQLENLLVNNHFDSIGTKKINYKRGIINIVKIVIGFLFITLGFSMIIMPAPPYFEMFVIFNFTADDGFTLMDLISLIIIATGVYIVLRSVIRPKYDG